MAQWLDDIYREHRQGLFTLALAVAGTREDAEDAVHDAFARLCREPQNHFADGVAYAFAAVRNAALDRVRRRRVRSTTESLFDVSACDENGPVERVCERERNRMVQSIVAALPDDKRQVVVLKVYAELTFAQISEILGEPISTIASRYQRALENVREVFGGVMP